MCNCVTKSAFKEDFNGRIEKKMGNWSDLEGIRRKKSYQDKKYAEIAENLDIETDEKCEYKEKTPIE